MKQLRKLLFWCHLLAGVSAGLVLFVMAGTGVLLTYERQIVGWADTRHYQTLPAPGATRLPIAALVERARTGHGGVPATLTISSDPAEPVGIGFGQGRTLFVSPYTGEPLGGGATGARAFFRSVEDVHRWLGASGEGRAKARAVTGACNLAFLLLVLSGAYLWIPRVWTRAQLRNVAWFRLGLGGKARDFNWHNVVGLWCFAPLFVIVLSGVVISYPWASDLVYRIAGEPPPPPRPRERRSSESEPPPAPLTAGLDPLLVQAERKVPGWRSITLQLPTKEDAPASFNIDSGTGGQPYKRAALTLDRKTGEVARWEPFSSGSPGRRLRVLLRFAHTGEVLGPIGQTLAGLASAGAALLVFTGLSLALRRLAAWRTRRAAS